MLQQRRFVWGTLILCLALAEAAYGQGTEFSWKMGPVDVHNGQTAKLVFANPFCANPLTKLDVTVAITDLTGQIVQVRVPGSQPTVARKEAIVNCNDSIQLEVSGDQISPNGSVIGVLQVISDISGIPWVPVNVPLASLQVGTGTASGFRPSVVIIPIEPVRRLILP